ncbi:MAG: hypothetical protein LCH54_15030 [Bacteroidetes bacterium]|nr:hypothetical protein [Bacteroidota bacterium]
MKKMMLMVTLLMGMVSASYAQFSVGTDIVSQYVWRGVPQTGASYQPYIGYTFSGITVGAWASAPIGGLLYENDLYIGYAGENFGVTVTDYYYPTSVTGATDFLSFDSDTGAHTVELSGYFTSNGFKIFAAVNVFASKAFDPDQAAYAELSYTQKTEEAIDVTYTAGAAFKLSNDEKVAGDWYLLTSKKGKKESFGITNLSVTASKTIAITDKFSLPVYGSYIVNPYAKLALFVFGFKF